MPSDNKNKSSIHINNLRFSYEQDKASANSFHCDNWTLQAGQHGFLYGASGSGKSTLLNLLSGILTPQQGSIELLGTDITTLKASQRDQFRAINLGIVFQQFNLIPYLSVIDNIKLAAYFAKSKRVLQEPVLEMMTFLKLPEYIIEQPVSSLSVGQRQRVAIIRAFINQPKILLVDEPTSSLDSDARDGFMTMLLTLTEKNQSTLLFVSHDEALKSHFNYQIPLSDIGHWHSEAECNNA